MFRIKPFLTLMAVGALAATAPGAEAQRILQNFTGSSSGQSGYIPPDTNGAVGLGTFVELINGRYASYGKAGGAPQQSSSLDQFWANAGVSPTGAAFDPRVVYDPLAQRFYASSLDFGPTDAQGSHYNNDILLAVSNSADPAAGWTGLKIPSYPAGGTDNAFADFDTLGFNRDGVYVAVNSYPTTATGGYGVSILAMSQANLAARNAAGATLIYNVDPNRTGFSVQPAVDRDNTGGTEYLLSDYNTPAGQNKVSAVIGTDRAPTLSTAGGVVTVTGYQAPPTAHQPNGDNSLDAGDLRFSGSVVKVGGELWAVQGVNIGGRAGLRWVRINAATGFLIAEGTIADAGHDYYDGSIAVNGLGSLVVGYTRSGATEFASSYASVGTYTATQVAFGDPLLLKAGIGNYDISDGTSNRWGDYSATTVDPTDSTRFWTIQEWASAGNTWSTQITEITAAPEPSALCALALGSLALLGRVAARRRAAR